jgi:hypothetical protein
MTEFDVAALYAAMDAQRVQRGLSWSQVARAIWEQSAALNRTRHGHPISPATLTGIAKRRDTSCQHALFILRWLERSPESFLTGSPAQQCTGALPATGDDRRLRWNLRAVYEAVNVRRQIRGLTWREAARELRCTEHQLTGIRTARFAIGMRLMMRLVQWVDQPSAAFIYRARW